MKASPGAIVSLDVREGVSTRGFKLLDAANESAVRAQGIFDAP
jgi:hypothetical protein